MPLTKDFWIDQQYNSFYEECFEQLMLTKACTYTCATASKYIGGRNARKNQEICTQQKGINTQNREFFLNRAVFVTPDPLSVRIDQKPFRTNRQIAHQRSRILQL
jgi:tRNA(His) 5'-end guanylyltransferase